MLLMLLLILMLKLVLMLTPAGDDGEGVAGPKFGHLHLVFRDWNYSGTPEEVGFPRRPPGVFEETNTHARRRVGVARVPVRVSAAGRSRISFVAAGYGHRDGRSRGRRARSAWRVAPRGGTGGLYGS